MIRGLGLILFVTLVAGAAWFAFAPAPNIVEVDQQTRTADIVASSPSAFEFSPFEGEFTLALSWQPGFCLFNPFKPECVSQTKNRYDAKNLSLHGLWPEPRGNIYCDVSKADEQRDKQGQWKNLEALELTAQLRAQLNKLMPGVQSYLHRHEWIKHGTCAQTSPQGYFAASVTLQEKVNQSSVGSFLKGRIGENITIGEVQARFDQAFGSGSGARVSLKCGEHQGQPIIQEIRISLDGEVSAKPDLGTLLLNASKRQGGCREGVLVPVKG